MLTIIAMSVPNPQNDEQNVLTPKLIIRGIPRIFEPKQNQTAMNSNTLTAHQYLFNKHSESFFIHETLSY